MSVDWISSAKILFSSALASILTYVLISELAFSNPMKLFIGIVAFIVILIATALITKTVNPADISNLREIANGLGFLRRLLNLIISFLEKLLGILQRTNSI